MLSGRQRVTVKEAGVSVLVRLIERYGVVGASSHCSVGAVTGFGAGSYCVAGGSTDSSVTCPAGDWCPGGGTGALGCPSGYYSTGGASSCSPCTAAAGMACYANSVNATGVVCPGRECHFSWGGGVGLDWPFDIDTKDACSVALFR